MNKNFKILSSLAAAGIITVTGLTSAVSAATPNSLGVYRKVVTGKTVVPYVVATANDKVTVQNLKNDHGTITISLSNSENVATGTTFRKDGEEHTVIIYGDVNKDGSINVNDVTTLAQGIVKNNLDAIQKEAGNVVHNTTTDVNDVTKLARFIVRGEGISVSLPAEETPTVEYAYSIAVNGNNVINSETKTTSTIKVTPSEVSDEEQELTLVIAKKGEDGKYTDETITMITGNKITLLPNEMYVEKELDFSGLTADGTYRLQLKQGTKVVGEAILERHVDVSKIEANVIVKRAGSLNAVVSLEGYGEAEIVKMYCKVAASNTTINTALRTDLINNGTVLPISNNTLPETLFTNNDVAETNQALFYVLEDSYGSIIATPLKVLVADDVETNTQGNTTIEEITANTNNNEFSIKLNQDLETGRNVVATLYLNGKVVASEKIAGTSSTTETTVVTTTFASKMTTVGTYTVKAYVEGTQEKQPSATVDSTAKAEEGKIVMTQLSQVSNIQFVHDDKTNKDLITWEDSSNVDATYTVTALYPKKVNSEYTGEYTDNSGAHSGESDVAALTITVDATGKKQAEVTGITANTSYKVQIVANPKAATPQRVLPSEEKVSSEFYKLSITNLSAYTQNETSVTFTGITPVTLVGNEDAQVSYKMGVYSYTRSANGNELETKLIDTKNVTLTKTKGADTYETTVIGLEEGKEYKFVLLATIGNVTTETAQTGVIKLARRAETINGLTVVKGINNEEDAKVGEISYTVGNAKAYINGSEVVVAEYTADFQNLLNDVIAPLTDGDKVTVSGNNIEVILGASGLATTTFGTTDLRDSSLKGKTLTLVGNDAWRTVVTKAGDNNKIAEVILKAANGAEALFTVGAEINAEKVTLNGIKLKETANQTYTLAAGATNVINNIETTVSKDTIVTMAAGTISAKASDSNLTVVNNSNADLEVAIVGDANLDLKQTGSITITSKAGDITVSSPRATVSGTITANIENGILDITEDTLTGAKKVTVTNKKDATTSETTVIKAKLATSAPVAMNNVAIKDYSETELADMKNVTGLTAADVTEDNLESIKNFIDSLGLEEDIATVSVTGTDLKEVTITITGNVANYVVPGLQ